MAACVFCDIVAGRSPASVIHRDDLCVSFMDICPVNAGHLLIVPVRHATYLSDLDPDVGRALFGVAQRLSQALRRSGLKAEGITFFFWRTARLRGKKSFMCTCTFCLGSTAMASVIDFRRATDSGRRGQISARMPERSGKHLRQPNTHWNRRRVDHRGERLSRKPLERM